MHRFTKIDFTDGNIVLNVFLFSLPIIAGELLQNLYNSVDALVVGNFVSEKALAAVMVCGIIAGMLVNFFNGMSVGSNVVVAKSFGRGDTAETERAIRIGFSFAVLLGIALTALSEIFASRLLWIAGAKPDYYAEAMVYLRIYLLGLMFTVIYNNGAGILRAVGDAGTPFKILLISSTVNIVTDVFLVVVLRLGIAGVGIATVLSQFVSVTLIYRAIARRIGRKVLSFGEVFQSGKSVVSSILQIGVAAGMQSALIGISNLFVVRYINLFDTTSVAGIGIAQRLDKFIVLPVKSFGITMSTYVGQNLGAAKYDRIRAGKSRCLALGLGMTIVLSLIVFAFVDECVSLFNNDPAVVRTGREMMHVLLPCFWIMATREIYTGILRGYGHSLMPMILSLIGMIGFRQVFLAITMRTAPSIRIIYICYPLAWAVTTVLILIYYRTVRKKLPGMVKNSPS